MLQKFNEFKENEKNTPVLYKDDKLEIKVVKTLDSAKLQNKNTSWCSSSRQGFYDHDKTANMFRFNFSDGYKLRLTWDYIAKEASELGSYSGGTHWGQGGIVDGEEKWYSVLRPKDENEPFLFDYDKEEKKEMVDRIESIPQKAIDEVTQYHNKNTTEKSHKIANTYKEISNIKINKIEKIERYKTDDANFFEVTISYKGQQMTFDMTTYKKEKKFYRINTWDIQKKFKNAYIVVGDTLQKYLTDKIAEYCKKNQIQLYE